MLLLLKCFPLCSLNHGGLHVWSDCIKMSLMISFLLASARDVKELFDSFSAWRSFKCYYVHLDDKLYYMCGFHMTHSSFYIICFQAVVRQLRQRWQLIFLFGGALYYCRLAGGKKLKKDLLYDEPLNVHYLIFSRWPHYTVTWLDRWPHYTMTWFDRWPHYTMNDLYAMTCWACITVKHQ